MEVETDINKYFFKICNLDEIRNSMFIFRKFTEKG